jgi:hypothetical protein
MGNGTNASKGKRSSTGRGTFKYAKPYDNHVVLPGREEALHQFIHQSYGGMQHKLRNACSSNSEDALTWSFFDVLAQAPDAVRREALTNLWELGFGTRATPEGVLAGTIAIGKRYGTGESTETDVSIEGPGALVFIEAKLYSPMSMADPSRAKPHNQIERKLRVGLREAAQRKSNFYFVLLDIAPLEALRSLNPGVSLADATKPHASGFASKWLTAYWFSRYKYGSSGSRAPLQRLISDAAIPSLPAKDVAERMGWLTWADVAKAILRTAIATPSSVRS